MQKSDRGRKPSALKTGKAPGAASKLDARQKRRLLTLLASGPEAVGFAGQLWTCPKMAELIRREFGVSYHVGYPTENEPDQVITPLAPPVEISSDAVMV